MKLIVVITTPATIERIKEAVVLFGVRGMTVSQVASFAHGGDQVQIYRGVKYRSDLRPCLKMELVVPDAEATDLMRVIETIGSASAPTESILWNSPIEILARVRTGEYGLDAL